MREPQWIWAAAGGALLAAAHFPFRVRRGSAAALVPASLLLWLSFLVVRAVFSPAPLRALGIVVFPLAVAAGGIVLRESRAAPSARAAGFCLVLTASLQLLLGGLQLLQLDPIFTCAPVKGLEGLFPAGFMGQHTIYGFLMALLSWLFLTRRNWLLFLLCAAALFFTKSAFGLAALAYGLLWFAFCRGWRRSAGTLMALLPVLGAWLVLYGEEVPGFFSHNGRLHIWVYAVNTIGEKPWLGFGIGAFSREFPVYHQVLTEMRWEEAHNELIEYVFNTGILGLAAFLPFAVTVLSRLRRQPHTREKELAVGVLLMTGVNAMGSFPLQIAPFATLAIYAVAWALRPLPGDTQAENG